MYTPYIHHRDIWEKQKHRSENITISEYHREYQPKWIVLFTAWDLHPGIGGPTTLGPGYTQTTHSIRQHSITCIQDQRVGTQNSSTHIANGNLEWDQTMQIMDNAD